MFLSVLIIDKMRNSIVLLQMLAVLIPGTQTMITMIPQKDRKRN